ncbi:hypothetical protein HDU93_001136 [Gonapodya sp. JEL0774]|nr:hypothetical protein HDU93_001136 [Gonapodya sp. JEL0774]
MDKALSAVLAAPHLHFLFNVGEHERKVFSQSGEDGVLEYIFDNIGTTDKYYVEFGTEACTECNTRYLWDEYKWDGLLMDGRGKAPDARVIKNHMISVENIVTLFEQYSVPKEFDLLSVDIDSVDYFVTEKILDSGYRPRVIISEVNPYFDPTDTLTVPENHTVWHGDPWFGQSPRLIYNSMEKYGYRAVYLSKNSVNMFSIRVDVLCDFIFGRTGVRIEPEDLARLLPPFEYLYRRQPPLHPLPTKDFRNQKLNHFVSVDVGKPATGTGNS